MPRSSVYYHLRRLRGSSDAVHLKYMKPLDVEMLVGVKRDKGLALKLLRSEADTQVLSSLGLPHTDYLYGLSVLAEWNVVAVYYKPSGLKFELAEDFFDHTWRVHQYPVQNCLGRREASREVAEALAERLTLLQRRERLHLRMPALAFLILAVLDVKPLATLRELALIAEAAEARELLESRLMIKLRYLQRYYRLLSAAYVAGRALVYPRAWRGHFMRLMLMAPKYCKKSVYGVVSATLTAPHVFVPAVGENGYVLANIGVSPQGFDSFVQLLYDLCPDASLSIRLKSMLFPFPYEYFDPLENRWDAKPHREFLEVIRRMRVASGAP